VKNYTTLLIVTILILVGFFLALYIREGDQGYLVSQEALMRHSTTGAARTIGLYLDETRRRVHLFAEEESGIIGELSLNPANEGMQQRFADRVKRHFPDYFAYTITDAQGNVLLDDFEGRVSELCQTDIHNFVAGNEQKVFIHPNPEGYHFDIMTRWQAGDGHEGVFFISFKPVVLARILANSQLHDHRLILLRRDKPGLIEVVDAGGRDALKDHIILDPDELNRIGFTTDVEGSLWRLADLPNPGLYAAHRSLLQRQAISIFLVFLFSSAVMYLLIRHEEKRRAGAEQAVRESRSRLEEWVADRTRELSAANTRLESEIRERQLAEEQLRQREEQLRLTLEHAPIGILTAGLDGRLLGVNPMLCNILGYTADELARLSIDDITHADDREATRGKFQELIDGNIASCDLEKHYLRKDGVVITVRARAGLVRDARKQPLMVVAEIEDITQRERAEMRFRLVVESAPNGIVMVDTSGGIVLVNSQLEKYFGYRRSELLGQPVEMLIPERLRSRHNDYRNRFLDEHRARAMGLGRNLFGLRKDGSEFPVEIGLSPMETDNETHILASIVDISERMQFDQELQRMRFYLKNIIDSMPSILVGVDMQGRVTEWNLSAEQATGVPTGQAIGQSFGALFPEIESQLSNLQESMRRQSQISTERLSLITDRNGETRYADVMVYPLMTNGAVGAVIRVDDITDRVRIEQMMVQTEKMMSVGGLAAGMAHEINNPLSGVLQSSQNIQRRLSEELDTNRQVAESLGVDLQLVYRYLEERGILEFVEAIRQAASRASRIVADMLAFSRSTTTEFQPARIEEILDTAVRLAANDYDLKKKYDFKRVEIVRELDPELDTLSCDPTEIEQVVLNLVKNAAQAMAMGGGPPPHRIILRTRKEGEYARIEVEDNGPGMDETTRRRVFEPFFTTKAVGAGTGLGLSVSYFIITEQHKGTIDVNSTPGQGTCFIVRLPLKRKPR
jgi:PAS domain S-box-containing protein